MTDAEDGEVVEGRGDVGDVGGVRMESVDVDDKERMCSTTAV